MRKFEGMVMTRAVARIGSKQARLADGTEFSRTCMSIHAHHETRLVLHRIDGVSASAFSVMGKGRKIFWSISNHGLSVKPFV